MFVANGARPGFWVRRTTWDNGCARVTSVGPFTSSAPYFGNPKVYADIHNLKTGEMREANARLPAAGTYNSRRFSIDRSNVRIKVSGLGNGFSFAVRAASVRTLDQRLVLQFPLSQEPDVCRSFDTGQEIGG